MHSRLSRLALIALIALSQPGATFGGISLVRIWPENPVPTDTILVGVHGGYPDLCFRLGHFELIQVSDSEFSATVYSYDDYYSMGGCPDMYLPYQYYGVIYPLPPGNYTIYATESFDTLRAWYSLDSVTFQFVIDSLLTYVDRSGESLPSHFGVLSSHPNPFNATTQIEFELPVTGAVTLQIFDVNGRWVSTLVDETVTAGSHTISFDGSAFASGIYFARLTAGSYSTTHKMVLLK